MVGGKATFALPIRNEYNPQIPVHFVLMRGRIAAASATSSRIDLGKPATMAATQWVKVNPVGNQMTVALTHPEKATPGQEITMQIRLSDPAGCSRASRPGVGSCCPPKSRPRRP